MEQMEEMEEEEIGFEDRKKRRTPLGWVKVDKIREVKPWNPQDGK